MTFDVAITSYRRPALLKDAVISCLHQGPLLNRVIIVDDASEDNTGEVIHSLNDPRIVFFQRVENGGIAAARRDAFAFSEADWTVSLDSDHELLPGAIDGFARLLASAGEPVDILGARYRWDTGAITPLHVPAGPISYEDRIRLIAQKNSIGSDYLCVVSRRVREKVKWEPLRAGLPDTLFQLDIARIGKAIFTSDTLGLQKSDGEFGWTRGSAEQRWMRRCQDAADAVRALNLILDRHGTGLRLWGLPVLAVLYRHGAFFAVLNGQRKLARRWVVESIATGGISSHAVVLAIVSILPRGSLRRLYLLRG